MFCDGEYKGQEKTVLSRFPIRGGFGFGFTLSFKNMYLRLKWWKSLLLLRFFTFMFVVVGCV